MTEIRGGMEVEQVEEIPAEELKTSYLFIHALGIEIINIILTILIQLARSFLRVSGQNALQVNLLGVLMVLMAVLIDRKSVV